MKNIEDYRKKAKINYPTTWVYKVIGQDVEKIKVAVGTIMDEQDYELMFSKASFSGKYYSIKMTTMVLDEKHRNLIYSSLNDHSDIITVV